MYLTVSREQGTLGGGEGGGSCFLPASARGEQKSSGYEKESSCLFTTQKIPSSIKIAIALVALTPGATISFKDVLSYLVYNTQSKDDLNYASTARRMHSSRSEKRAQKLVYCQ